MKGLNNTQYHYQYFEPDFCESKFTESWDREWDFWREFLRVENENESSRGKIESREWEWEFCGENESWDWEWDPWFFKNEGLIKTESAFLYDSYKWNLYVWSMK